MGYLAGETEELLDRGGHGEQIGIAPRRRNQLQAHRQAVPGKAAGQRQGGAGGEGDDGGQGDPIDIGLQLGAFDFGDVADVHVKRRNLCHRRNQEIEIVEEGNGALVEGPSRDGGPGDLVR